MSRLEPTPEHPERRLRVDRVACTGHRVCAAVLPQHIALDDHGYPIVLDDRVSPRSARQAVEYCPRRALYLTGGER